MRWCKSREGERSGAQAAIALLDRLELQGRCLAHRHILPAPQLIGVELCPIANAWDALFAITVGGPVEFFGGPAFVHHPVTSAVLPISHPGNVLFVVDLGMFEPGLQL